MTDFQPHNFTVPEIRKGGPVLACANVRCYVVWWPDRKMPASSCKGVAR